MFIDYPKGVGPSGSKREAPEKGEDIVKAVWKHTDAGKAAGKD